MKATEVLAKRKWKQNLSNRRYMGLFTIPKGVCDTSKVNDWTKRLVKIELNTGIKLKGAATVTSGREISIPTHLRHYFEEAEWFDCEIVNDTIYEKTSLDIY